ncbi:MAG TPA: IS200/IS605 family transposase [Cytophagaceae bacterium]
MPRTFSVIYIHTIWAVKNREPLLTKNIRHKLFDHILKVSRDKGFYIDFINGIEDHVHCLISLTPKYSLSKTIKDIKGASSQWIKEKSTKRQSGKESKVHHQNMSLGTEINRLEKTQ